MALRSVACPWIPLRPHRTTHIAISFSIKPRKQSWKPSLHSGTKSGKPFVRVGDMAFATNRFELYMDYMHRIQARSPFEQIFIVQLTGVPGPDGGTYLATERGAWGKGYSASRYCNLVSPKGGQELVDETVAILFSSFRRDRQAVPSNCRWTPIASGSSRGIRGVATPCTDHPSGPWHSRNRGCGRCFRANVPGNGP